MAVENRPAARGATGEARAEPTSVPRIDVDGFAEILARQRVTVEGVLDVKPTQVISGTATGPPIQSESVIPGEGRRQRLERNH